MRLIDADALEESFIKNCQGDCFSCEEYNGETECGLIDKSPKVQAITRQQLDEAVQKIKDIDISRRTGYIETIMTAEGMRKEILKILVALS